MLDPGTQRQRCGYAAALYLCLARITIVGKQVIAAADREAALPRARREKNRNSQASEASSVTHSTPLSDDKPQPLNWMAAAAHQDLNVVAPSRTTKDSSPALFLTGSGDMRFEPVHTSSLSADAEFTSPASFWDRPNSARSDLGPGQPSHPRCNSFACPNADVHGISAPDESWLDKLSAFFGGWSGTTHSDDLLPVVFCLLACETAVVLSSCWLTTLASKRKIETRSTACQFRWRRTQHTDTNHLLFPRPSDPHPRREQKKAQTPRRLRCEWREEMTPRIQSH